LDPDADLTRLEEAAMRRSRTTWMAWGLGGPAAALATAAIVLAAGNGEQPGELVAHHHAVGIVTAIGLGILGALIAGRRPGNPIGWLMGAAALFLGVFSFTQQYGRLAAAESLPGVAAASWLASWTNLPGIAIASTLVFQLFPDGRLPSPRWRPVAWLTVAATVVPAAVLAARAWPLRGPELAVQTIGSPGLQGTFQAGLQLALALSLVSLAAVVVRFRRSTGVERQQIKWFAYTAMIGIPLGVPVDWPFWGPILELLQPPLMFAGLGIGMFRYRLYDVDRLLNRTLVYGLLTASLAAGYATGVLVLGRLASGGRSDSLAVAATTLAVAAAFQPLRRGIQRAVDRRFDRRRYDAAATIEAFAVRLRRQVDADALTAELLAVVDQTVQPTRTSLWLRPAPGNGQP
jgi:hypothetical protein